MSKNLLLAFAFAATSATVGHGASDIRSDAGGVTIAGGAQTARVEVWSDRIVRVTHRPAGATAPPAASLAVIAQPQDTAWKFSDADGHVTLSTPAVHVQVDKTTGAVRFRDAADQPVLAETPDGTALTPATVGGVSTWRARQSFALAPDEGIYGLGQHPDGFLNHRGTNVHLQQENRIVGVPVLMSSRGYGVLWDNPAVTDVRVGAGEFGSIPPMQLFDEDGKPGGLTARYYRGRNFDTLATTRTDAQIDFLWAGAETPAEGMPHDDFSVRWSGAFEAKDAGDYQMVTMADDGVRLWVDDQLVIDEWKSNPGKSFRARFHFAAHSRHRIKLDYFQGQWDAIARLAWELPPDPTTLAWTSEAGDGVYHRKPMPTSEWEKLRDAVAEGRYYIIVSAYDFAASLQGGRTLLWRARMSTERQGVWMDDVVPGLVAGGAPLFGRATDRPRFLTEPIFREGKVEVGPVKVLEMPASSSVPPPAQPPAPAPKQP